MSNETNPREFWIERTLGSELTGDGDYTTVYNYHTGQDSVHVIEFSAVESLRAELDFALKTNAAKSMKLFNAEFELERTKAKRDFWHSACAKECNEKDAAQSELKHTKDRLNFQDKWLSNGIYYTTSEWNEMVGKPKTDLEARLRVAESALENIEFCPRSISENVIADMQATAHFALRSQTSKKNWILNDQT